MTTAPRARGSRWVVAVVVAVLAVAVVWLAAGTVRTVQRLRAERVRGTVTVAGCTFHHSAPRARDVYSCVGEFTSETGDVRVPSVSFPHEGSLRRGARVAARVSGPADGTATIGGAGGALWWTACTGAAAAVLLAYLLTVRRGGRGARGAGRAPT